MNHLSHPSISEELQKKFSEDILGEVLDTDALREGFKELRKQYDAEMPDYTVDDATIAQFLRADTKGKKVNVGKSLKRLLDTVAFRKKIDIDRRLAENDAFPHQERYKKTRVRVWLGVDKENRPLIVERVGKFSATSPGVKRPFSADEWVNLWAWDMEEHLTQMRKSSLACGKAVHKFCMIGDLKGSGTYSGMKTLPLLKLLGKNVETFYPEIVGKVILINAGTVFASLYKIAKRFLDPITAAKIEVHSGVPKKVMENYFDVSIIPVEFGGTNEEVVVPPLVHWKKHEEHKKK